MLVRKFASYLLAWFALFMTGCEPAADSRSAAVDAVFAAFDSASRPGCAVGVVENGRLLHKAGYGMANLEHGVPFGPRTATRMASVSKQFTAAAVLLLVEQGRLDLDADIHRYLPELPDYGATVTLRHLLQHTSGLPSLDESVGFQAASQPDYYDDYPGFFAGDEYDQYRFLSISEYLAGIASVDSLKFPPGSRFEYNNPGYFLAGQIVERVSGQTLRDFTRENIFEPLGMHDTFFNDRVMQVLPGAADAYLPLPDQKVLRYNTDLNMVGDGGLFTTIEDFFLWDQNFYDNKLGTGSEFIVEQMRTPNTRAYYAPAAADDDYNGGRYGFGLRIANTRGYRLEAHGGSWVGYRTQALRYPELKLSVFVFCNSALIDPWALSKQVAEIYLPEEDNVTNENPPAAVSWPDDDWQISGPAAEGLDAAALSQLDSEFRSGRHGHVDSMLVIRHGRIAFENYYENDYAAISGTMMTANPGPYNYYDTNWHPFYKGSDLHTLQSASKSIMSALVGIAIDRGDLAGTDATLGELLPHRKISDPRKSGITLENLLKMQPGFAWEEDVSYWDPRNDAIIVESSDDWVAYLLAKPLAAEQGTTYKYNSIATQLLSEIVSTSSGMALDKYAEQHLFGPLGIDKYFWKTAPEGFKDVSGGLYMTPRALARFALLYERGGNWRGRQIVPREWVRKSALSYTEDLSPDMPDYTVSYGYQWWTFRSNAQDAPQMYGAWGWGGQFALIVPELNLIAVFTGWNIYEDENYRYAWDLFYDQIVLTSKPM